jgi:hypothetical protein
MKIKTIRTSKEYEWHKQFLWIPKKVRSCKDKNNLATYTIESIEFRYEWLWLETVERKNVSLQSFDTDDGKYIYWKQL